MTTIIVPFHLDERLAAFDPPVDPAPGTCHVVDPVLLDGPPWPRMALLQDHVAARVAESVRGGAVPVVVSGDCVTALGTVAGLQRAGTEPVVVWFDGHGDVQTPATSTSGYLGGMPVRQLVGDADRTVADHLDLTPVAERDVVLVDARDLDPPEVEYLADAAVRRTTVADAATAVSTTQGPIYLHVDVDVIDAAELPGALFPVSDGPSAAAVCDAVDAVLASGRVAAVGVACTWRPVTGAAGPVADLFGVLTGRLGRTGH